MVNGFALVVGVKTGDVGEVELLLVEQDSGDLLLARIFAHDLE